MEIDMESNEATRPSKQTSTTSYSMKDMMAVIKSSLQFLVFMIMGSGANWVFPTAFSQEIPYFELHQPEGLCIATFMNAATNIGLISLIVYMYIIHHWMEVPYKYSVPILVSLSAVGCFIAAGTYNVTINHVSIMIYFCISIGGTVGALSNVIMSAFLVQFENNKISAARAGGSGLILISALIAAIQSPGNSDMRFSVTVYMIIFGLLLSLPAFAYFYIVETGIGLRVHIDDDPTVDVPIVESNPIHDVSKSDKSSTSSTDSFRQNSVAREIESLEFDPVKRSYIDRLIYDILYYTIPDRFQKKYPYLLKVLPYAMNMAWVDFNNWGMIFAALPFAIQTTSYGEGTANLGIAYQIGALCLVSGDLSTTQFRIPFKYSSTAFTICAFIIYLASFNLPAFQHPHLNPLIIVCYCVTQFMESHMLTTSFRACATEFPIQHRESCSQIVGTFDQVGTTFGAIVSTIIIASIASC